MQNKNYLGPYYRYNLPVLRESLSVALENAANYQCELKYALKANNEKRILSEIKKKGLGIDCVSQEEIAHALELGWEANTIVFAGSGKTIREIEYAISENIGYLHCESYEEWEIAREVCNQLNSTTKLALRINPDIKVATHDKISTGEKHHKFGMAFEEALTIIGQDQQIAGFHFHVGSQILDMNYFEELSLTVRTLMAKLPETFRLEYLNLGGGLGINYDQPERCPIPDFQGWMQALRKHLPTSFIDTIVLEPGRSIVGQCGQLIGEVQYVKNISTNPTAILDVGMTEILRPALYGAHHHITVNKDSLITENYTVSGPSCESSDTFGKSYQLPILERGDLVTIHSVGAYGSSMRLAYNLRKRLPVSYVETPVKTQFKILARVA